jgi:PAS domain S-box-containing protein
MHRDLALDASRPPRRAPLAMDESIPAMVWGAGPDMACEYLSREWLRFTGLPAAQALGDGWSRGVHPEDLARWLDACVRAFDAREPFCIEYRMRRHDGEYRWVLDRAVPRFAADGEFLGYVGTCVDIDERKRCEHELARALERERKLRTSVEDASRLKDGFLATVLQDLQAPIQAIAAWARHLRQQAVPASEAAGALESIERNALAQARIIADLLDLSRVAGASAPRRRPAANERFLSGTRVLVVDDDPAARESVVKVLGIAGADVKAASGADEALEALGAFHADVLLCGLGMAREGYALIRGLRGLPAERGGCLRAAALTQPSRPEDGLRAVAAGYDAQLIKPVEPVALLATVSRLAQPS